MSDADEKVPEFRQLRFTPPPGAADILLVRHGESAPSREDDPVPLVDGHADPPLDPRGHEEAELLAKRLDGETLAAIYISPLQRTAQTAAPLAARLGLTPKIDPDLVEVHLGEWEGSYRRQVREGNPIVETMFREERWDAIPGAESAQSLRARVSAAITRIAAAHQDQRVLVVAHGGVIGTIMSVATGSRPFAFVASDNASLSHLVVTGDNWFVRRFNDTSHLLTDLDRPPA